VKRQTIKITTALDWSKLDGKARVTDCARTIARTGTRRVDPDTHWPAHLSLVACRRTRRGILGGSIHDDLSIEGRNTSREGSVTAQAIAKLPQSEGPQDRSGVELGDMLDFDALADRALAASWYQAFEEGR
jgi:hypothetical protein